MTDDEILREYLPWLRKAAGGLAGFDSPDLPDLVQEGYIAMWRALRSFDASRGQLPSWLTLKAHARMKTLVIRGREHPEREPVPLDDILTAPDLIDSVVLAYHHGEIAAAIGRLTPQQKRYVFARFWLGLSGKQMVELGVFSYDPSALWTRKRNGARWKLREDLWHLTAS